MNLGIFIASQISYSKNSYLKIFLYGRVVKLVYTPALGAGEATHGGSSPLSPTLELILAQSRKSEQSEQSSVRRVARTPTVKNGTP